MHSVESNRPREHLQHLSDAKRRIKSLEIKLDKSRQIASVYREKLRFLRRLKADGKITVNDSTSHTASRTEIESMRLSIQSLEEKWNHGQNAINDWKQKFNELEQKNAEIEARNHRLEQELIEREEEISKLMEALDHEEAQCSDLQVFQCRNEELIEEMVKIQGELDSALVQREDLQSTLQTQRVLHQELIQKCKAKQEMIGDSQTENGKIQSQLDNMKKEYMAMNAKNHHLMMVRNEMEREIRGLHEYLVLKDGELQKFNHLKKQHEEEMKRLKEENEKISGEKEERMDNQEYVEKVESENESLRKRIGELEGIQWKILEEKEAFRIKCGQKMKEMRDLYETQLALAQSQQTNVEQEPPSRIDWKAEITSLKEQCRALQMQKEFDMESEQELQQSKRALQLENLEQVRTIASLRAEVNQWKLAAYKLETEYGKMQEELSRRKEVMSRQSEMLRDYEDEIASMKQEDSFMTFDSSSSKTGYHPLPWT